MNRNPINQQNIDQAKSKIQQLKNQFEQRKQLEGEDLKRSWQQSDRLQKTPIYAKVSLQTVQKLALH